MYYNVGDRKTGNSVKKVLVIGSTVADIHIHLDQLPTLEEDVNIQYQKMTLGGCAFNVASVIADLGVPCTLFSPVGKGIYGDFILNEAENAKVRPCLRSDEENGCCYCLIDNDGNRTFMSVHGTEYHFKEEWFNDLDAAPYDLVYVCGLEIEEETGKYIIDFLKKNAEKYICYAPGGRIAELPVVKNEETMQACSLLHLNRREALAYLDKLHDPVENAREAAQKLNSRYHCDVVITDGAKKVVSCENGELCVYPVKPVKQRNSTGAGDAHCAAILACRAKGETLAEAVRHANEVSAKVVMSDSSGKD